MKALTPVTLHFNHATLEEHQNRKQHLGTCHLSPPIRTTYYRPKPYRLINARLQFILRLPRKNIRQPSTFKMLTPD